MIFFTRTFFRRNIYFMILTVVAKSITSSRKLLNDPQWSASLCNFCLLSVGWTSDSLLRETIEPECGDATFEIQLKNYQDLPRPRPGPSPPPSLSGESCYIINSPMKKFTLMSQDENRKGPEDANSPCTHLDGSLMRGPETEAVGEAMLFPNPQKCRDNQGWCFHQLSCRVICQDATDN